MTTPSGTVSVTPWIKAKTSSHLGGKLMGPEATVNHRAFEFSLLILPGRVPLRHTLPSSSFGPFDTAP